LRIELESSGRVKEKEWKDGGGDEEEKVEGLVGYAGGGISIYPILSQCHPIPIPTTSPSSPNSRSSSFITRTTSMSTTQPSYPTSQLAQHGDLGAMKDACGILGDFGNWAGGPGGIGG